MGAFNPKKFTGPDRLRSLDPARLRAFLAPWRDYLAKRGFAFPEAEAEVDYVALANVLLTPDHSTPRGMVDALYYVHETASAEDMDELIAAARRQGVPLKDDPAATPADLAIDVWLTAPDLLQVRHSEAVARRQQNFEYFAPNRGGKRLFPEIGDALRQQMETELDDWFENHRRGRGCRIFVFRHAPLVWILVRHGLPMRREAGHQDDGDATTQFYRPQQHDVLLYDERNGEIGVHANTKGERKLYLATFGKFVFGDEDHFPPFDKFTLEPLAEDAAAALEVGDIAGISAVRLVECRRYWGGPFKEVEIRRAENVLAALAARGGSGLVGGRLVAATFKVKFDGSDKERAVTIRPPGIARYERSEDSEVVDHWLRERGFILTNQGADDDETATAVLEGA
jgi:hypothetical protein